MNRSEVKVRLESSLGSLLTNLKDGKIDTREDFGKFCCTVGTFDHFTMIQRNFETSGVSLNIPMLSQEPGVQMLFSLNGQSFFNKRSDPFFLSQSSHSINFFRGYECTNLLDDRSQQHDITFLLKKSFYAELIAQHLSSAEDCLPAMIAKEKEFNTINQHIPADDGVLGILKNILECPFEGKMKNVFIREHLRALLTLQLFHFNSIVTGDSMKVDTKITTRDRAILHDIKEYIDQHYLDPASLETLSRHFGLNEFKLKHGFRALFDTSPMRYFQHKRLTFALSQLRETDKTIKEISDEIGYSHPANFTTAFSKTFGSSPQHYRRTREVAVHPA